MYSTVRENRLKCRATRCLYVWFCAREENSSSKTPLVVCFYRVEEVVNANDGKAFNTSVCIDYKFPGDTYFNRYINKREKIYNREKMPLCLYIEDRLDYAYIFHFSKPELSFLYDFTVSKISVGSLSCVFLRTCQHNARTKSTVLASDSTSHQCMIITIIVQTNSLKCKTNIYVSCWSNRVPSIRIQLPCTSCWFGLRFVVNTWCHLTWSGLNSYRKWVTSIRREKYGIFSNRYVKEERVILSIEFLYIINWNYRVMRHI